MMEEGERGRREGGRKGEERTRRTVSNSTTSHSGRVLGVGSIEVFERREVEVLGCGGVLVGGYLRRERKQRRKGEVSSFVPTSMFCRAKKDRRTDGGRQVLEVE